MPVNSGAVRAVTDYAFSKAPIQIPMRQQLYQIEIDKKYITFSLKLLHHRDTARELDRVHLHSLPS